jgi:osmotically-inducible protein OsmY
VFRCFVALSVSLVSTVCIGCSADIATEERAPVPPRTVPPMAVSEQIAVPQSAADLGIHRDLAAAIAEDADLRKRDITFRVASGDITVTGTVHTEEERRRINDLAMNIGGVKSVANALRVDD